MPTAQELIDNANTQLNGCFGRYIEEDQWRLASAQAIATLAVAQAILEVGETLMKGETQT